jgi:cell wall-associated NlpC family hydrolase
VYKKEGSFYLVRTPDGYLGWVDALGIFRIDATELLRYREAPRIVYLDMFGSTFETADESAGVAGDIVLGAQAEVTREDEAFFEIRYPDGRKAFVRKDEAELYNDWVASFRPTPDGLVETAHDLMGVPYLWGGTSPKAVDCSGFTKTIYLMHGIVLPRDASQQVFSGTLIDDTRDFSRLIPGDLLFFGRAATDSTRERVIHVGMWIGNDEFVHSSGRVRVSSMDSSAPNFDRYNLNRYLRTKRILGSSSRVWSVKDDGLFWHVTSDG